MNKDLEQIVEYLKEKRGFDSSAYRPAMVERRVNKRISASGCTDYNEYLHLLHEHGDEISNLIDVLTINMTRFFRDTLTFEYIADKILPLIVSKKIQTDDRLLRMWSAGCATGEEPYSLAILMEELFRKEEPDLDMYIFATDIDDKSLIKARDGVYPFESIKNIKYRLLKKYFIEKGKSFRLVPKIRDSVKFSVYDVLDRRSYAPPESIFGSFDMVFCRNLLIYFQFEYHEIIFEKLYRSLAKGGYLVLGESESPSIEYRRYFMKVTDFCHIYQKR